MSQPPNRPKPSYHPYQSSSSTRRTGSGQAQRPLQGGAGPSRSGPLGQGRGQAPMPPPVNLPTTSQNPAPPPPPQPVVPFFTAGPMPPTPRPPRISRDPLPMRHRFPIPAPGLPQGAAANAYTVPGQPMFAPINQHPPAANYPSPPPSMPGTPARPKDKGKGKARDTGGESSKGSGGSGQKKD